jgi:hypothetical protein
MYHNVLIKFGQVIRESIGIDAKEFSDKIKLVSNPVDDLPTPEQVKEFLLDTFKMKDWKTFIDSQLYGGCQELAELVVAKFPAVKIIQGDGKLSKKAAKKLNATSVAAKMFTHYFNKIGNTYYDFGKGTNTESDVYLMEGLGDKYSVELTEKELSSYYDLFVRHPRN